MHTRFTITSIAIASLALIAACDGGSGGSSGGADASDTMDAQGDGAGKGVEGPGAFDPNYIASGEFFTNMAGFLAGSSPHGTAQIWYSDNLDGVIDQASFTAPEGSVAIKPFDNDGSAGVDGLAVMVKKGAGYDSDNGDWLYEMRDPDGNVMDDPDGNPMSGPIGMCIGCHSASSGTDYLAGTDLTGGAPLTGPGAFAADFEDTGYFTLMAGPKAGTSPHGTVQIWYSNNMRHLAHQSAFEVPEGTAAIKRFDNDGAEGDDGYAVMVKQAAGYDVDNGDWLYEMRDMDGNVMDDPDGNPMSGPIGMCIGCHTGASDTDYLAGLGLR